MQYSDEHLRYLRLLSQKYQTVAAAASEIIRIEALLRLPKGTEHFMSDLHGEHEAFVHILNSASGVIREKIDTVLGNGVPAEERAELATLIYYPNQKLPELKARQKDLHAWYRMTLLRLIDLCRFVSSKHTRDHVRHCLPQNCGYILDELLHAHFEDHDKDQYYGEIIESIIRYDRADAYIIRFCEVIKRLAVDRLHIVGDLFDRGPRPDRILDSLMAHHQVDIQWGNHDVVWMGAAAGSPARLAGQDFLWYLWCGAKSPLFGRSAMTTFERLYIADPAAQVEIKDPYYRHIADPRTAEHILREFGLSGEGSHIVNGHVPVRAIEGESPIKGGGRLIIIDGGFCRAYHRRTGIAGYTLVYNSRGLILRTHQPFESVDKAIHEDEDIASKSEYIYTAPQRILVRDTDEGGRKQALIRDLTALVEAYQSGVIAQGVAQEM